MSKGADSHIIPRLKADQDSLIQSTQDFLSDYAKDGLRTLILAQREIDPDFYQGWSSRYTKALSSMTDRQDMIDKCAEEIEQEMSLIGSTAIEDKL